MSGIGAGLGSLIQGMQQGYSYMDEMKRKKADDEFQAKARTRQTQQWDKSDSYDSEVAALTGSYFPQPKAAGSAMPAAAGTALPPTAMAQPGAAQEAPGAPAQAAAAAQPNSPAAMGTGAAPAAAPDPMANTNNTLDFAMKRALIDVKHGKMDGVGLMGLQKTVDAMRSEKMDQSIALMNQGRYDEAISTFNSTGEHRATLIDVKDGIFDAGGTKIPTKIVTIQDGNGAPRTINTAQALYQRQAMDKIISQAQAGQTIAETGRHNAAAEQETSRHNKGEEGIQSRNASTAAAQLGISQQREKRESALFKQQTIAGQLEQIESVVGPLSPADRTAYGKKLLGLTAKDSKGVDDDLVKDITKKYSENNPTATPNDVAKFRDGLNKAFGAVRSNSQVENALRDDFAKNPPGTAGYTKTYNEAKDQLRMTDAQLAALGYNPPGGGKAPMAANGTMVPNPMAPSSVAPTWQSPTERVQAQAAAGFDAALAQTASALAAANQAGNKPEVQRLNALFAEQSAAKQASLGGAQ